MRMVSFFCTSPSVFNGNKANMCQTDSRVSFISLIMMIFVFLASSDGVTSGKHQQIFVMRETQMSCILTLLFLLSERVVFLLGWRSFGLQKGGERSAACVWRYIWFGSDPINQQRNVCESVKTSLLGGPTACQTPSHDTPMNVKPAGIFLEKNITLYDN